MAIEAKPLIRRAPWGKTDTGTEVYHHLAHHCADVAACFEAIASLPVIHSRLVRTAGESLSPIILARLAVLCFLHDAGKLHPGFQAKGWSDVKWSGQRHGHIHEGAAIFRDRGMPAIAGHLCLDELCRWGVGEDLLYAALAHHGLPFKPESRGEKGWDAVQASTFVYDPICAAAEVGAAVRRWFPLAFSPDVRELPSAPGFHHLFCGFVAIADWLGSDRRFFPFIGTFDPDYIEKARSQAKNAVTSIGLNISMLHSNIRQPADFSMITGFAAPNTTQKIVDEFPPEEQLVVLEAETGSGKTEAAFMRFTRLLKAGKVDGLYFALPTRSSAVQMHGRVNRMLKRLFGRCAPEAVLAVPGYLKVGEVEGEALPGWQVRWEDEGSVTDDVLEARWAAESSKRYLAAMVAVGTVDQAMLGVLQVKHAHLRGAALSRSLLVIDEVHASDSYMTEVQRALLRLHLERGGSAILMSATLGSGARAKWLDSNPPAFEEAIDVPFPAVWGKHRNELMPVPTQDGQKDVDMTLVPTMEPEESARLAIQAARGGARVLVIRNTVKMSVSTWSAVQEAGGENLLLNVSDGPALHHGRFAPDDRKILDIAVENALSPKLRSGSGVIVIGTQTLEQSLDIDADLLITDLCPVDVLLQRIGRLHRHRKANRPIGFGTPICYVMSPAKGLAPLLRPDFENGLGAWRENTGVFTGIYRDLSMLELTRRLVLEHSVWSLPAMNRLLVESATHEERIVALHLELGREWGDYRNNVIGKEIADIGMARNVVLPVDLPFAEVLFPQNEEKIRTRLGGEGARITFAEPVTGPFGNKITGLTLPVHWSRGLDTRLPVTPAAKDGLLAVAIGDRMFTYSRSGIMKGSK